MLGRTFQLRHTGRAQTFILRILILSPSYRPIRKPNRPSTPFQEEWGGGLMVSTGHVLPDAGCPDGLRWNLTAGEMPRSGSLPPGCAAFSQPVCGSSLASGWLLSPRGCPGPRPLSLTPESDFLFACLMRGRVQGTDAAAEALSYLLSMCHGN